MRFYNIEWNESERENQISYIKAYMWTVEKGYRWTYFPGRNRDADTKNEHVDAGVGRGSGMDWEIRIDKYTPPCVKQIASGI